MPAIQLGILRGQSSELVKLIDHPDEFINKFKSILEFYLNVTLRSHSNNIHENLLKYSTPSPVIRLIENDLKDLGEKFPDLIHELVSSLWETSIYECRLLAIHLLGTLPPQKALSLFSRLPEWLFETSEIELRDALFKIALDRFRKEYPTAFNKLIAGWLNSPGPKAQVWGLHALSILITKTGKNDLPLIFELLSPLLLSISSSTFLNLIECINLCCEISQPETIHFLLEISNSIKTKETRKHFLRLIRSQSPELRIQLKV